MKVTLRWLLAGLVVTGCTPATSTNEVDWTERIRAANQTLLNEGNMGAIPEFFTGDYVSNGAEAGHDGIASYLTALRSAFPDLNVSVEVLVTEGDRVAWIRTATGTHQGEIFGVAGTGQTVSWQDMVVTQYDGDMIAEEWGVSGLGEALRQ